ncbi:MAG: hypothetical protein WCK80_00710 [bacterium]
MRPLLQKLKPTSGFSHVLHIGLLLALPVILYVFVRANFIQLAIITVILSKWRMLAVRPRFWAANIRANSIDLMVGIATVIFMAHTASASLQILWAALYAVWLILLKPKSTSLMVTVQAFIGQFMGLSALYLAWPDAPVLAVTFLTGLFCFCAARHFFDIFDEPYARMLSYFWGYFAAALTWLLSHWLIYYGVISQLLLLISTLGYGLAVIYYLDHEDKLSKLVRRQFIFIMIAIVVVVLAFSDWGGKVV